MRNCSWQRKNVRMESTSWPCFSLMVLLQAASITVATASIAELCDDGGESRSWNRMEVLPGIGWDNLRNVDMGLVFEYDYTQCQLTNDRKFLLPDGCFAIPVQQSVVDMYSDMIEHWDDHRSLTSTSINTEASYHSGFSSVDAKFSYDYVHTKTSMYNTKSVMARVQIRHKLYIVRLQPGTTLHPMFKTRLLDIAVQMMNNNTQISNYLSEMLVRDYGTHYLTAVHAGAVIVQEDYLSKDSFTGSDEQKKNITASVAASFLGKIHLSTTVEHTTDEQTQTSYLTNRVTSHVRTFGGPPFRANFTIEDWENGLADTLVAIDREGVPLHFAIIPEVLTELPPQQTLKLAHYVEKAIGSYYKHNTRYGCTQPEASNFYFGANVDDKSCKVDTNSTYLFGGVYQTCIDNGDSLCSELIQKNPITGNYSCPPNYEDILLFKGAKREPYTEQDCHRVCHHHFLGRKHCHDQCVTVNLIAVAMYELHWCAHIGREDDIDESYLFGGMYSSAAINPLTHAKSCPNHYYPLKFGQDATVCVTDDRELGGVSSAPFAGFESCMAGNLLSTKQSDGSLKRSLGKLETDPKTWPHRCPTGYTMHLAVMEHSCEINYCVKQGVLDEFGLPPIKLPPFHKYPSTKSDLQNVLMVVSTTGDTYAKNVSTNQWVKLSMTEEQEYFAAFDKAPSNVTNNSMSINSSKEAAQQHKTVIQNIENSPATVALVISSTTLLGLVIVVVVYGMYKCKGRQKKQSSLTISYENLEQNPSTTSEIQMEPTADV